MMKRILFVKHGALGDVVRTSYLLKPVYEKYGNPEIFWYTSKNSIPLLRFHPFIHHLTYESNDLLNIEFDWIISLDDEKEILQVIDDLRYKKITGAYLQGEERIYTKDSAPWFDMGLISRYGKEYADKMKKLNKLGHAEIFSKILDIENVEPMFYNSKIIENSVLKQKNRSFFNVGINCGAGGRWESKKLRKEESVKLIKQLLTKKIQGKQVFIHLLGGNDELDANKNIISQINDEDHVSIADSEGSLLLFAAIMKSCDYIITSDSLALHLAISQGIPNLSFYAPTSASEIDTFGTGEKVISQSDDYCSYISDADNSTITAERLIHSMRI